MYVRWWYHQYTRRSVWGHMILSCGTPGSYNSPFLLCSLDNKMLMPMTNNASMHLKVFRLKSWRCNLFLKSSYGKWVWARARWRGRDARVSNAFATSRTNVYQTGHLARSLWLLSTVSQLCCFFFFWTHFVHHKEIYAYCVLEGIWLIYYICRHGPVTFFVIRKNVCQRPFFRNSLLSKDCWNKCVETEPNFTASSIRTFGWMSQGTNYV